LHGTVNEAFNLLPNGILIFDIKKKQITFANKEMADILGVSLTDFISSNNLHDTLIDKVCKFH
jgi:PAS domain-containing protein